MPTSSEKIPNATRAASAACFSTPAKSRCRVLPSCVTRNPFSLDLLNFGTAENTCRQEDQHNHQDRECGNVLVFDGKISRPERLNQSDQQSADHRPWQRADTSQYGSGEC